MTSANNAGGRRALGRVLWRPADNRRTFVAVDGGSTDCNPARAAVSSFSSNEPFKVHSITELAILALGGALDCGLASAAPATSAAPVFRSSLRSIIFASWNARIPRGCYRAATAKAFAADCNALFRRPGHSRTSQPVGRDGIWYGP